MSQQQGKIVKTVTISLNVTSVDWYTNQRNAQLSESNVTSVAKTITIYIRLCHKTSKKISEIDYQSDYDDGTLQFDTIDTSGWDG